MCEISIIMPVYNKARYVQNVLLDVQEQGFRDFECIIIDDGSTDLSGKICDDFAAQDNRFRVLHTPNSGVSHARNVGLAKAQGKYITFIDADDRIENGYLQKLYADIVSTNADMVIAGPLKFWEDDRQSITTPIPYKGVQQFKQLMPEFALVQRNTGIYGFCCGKLMSRELIGDTQFSEWLRLAEDFEFYLRLYPKVKTIYFEASCKYYYLQEADNSSAIIDSGKIDYVAQLKINLSYRKFLRDTGFYDGDNRKTVDALVANYAFLSIFHCVREEIPERVKAVHDLLMESKVLAKAGGFSKLAILFCVRHDLGNQAKVMMQTYDVLRGLKRRL